jgi:hypothetical protein
MLLVLESLSLVSMHGSLEQSLTHQWSASAAIWNLLLSGGCRIKMGSQHDHQQISSMPLSLSGVSHDQDQHGNTQAFGFVM